MKNDVSWDVTPCGSCNNLRFGRTNCLHHQVEEDRRARNNVSSPILATMTLKALRSSQTSVPTRATRRNIPEDVIHHSYCRENLTEFSCYLYICDIVESDKWASPSCTSSSPKS
jgi:hypothetical protein